MTEARAMARAKQRAKETQEDRYVVYDPSYRDVDNAWAYYVATGQDVDTWFAGARIIAFVGPSGRTE